MRGFIQPSPGVASFGAYVLARLLEGTLRRHVSGEERLAELIKQNGKGVILVTWHGRTFIPVARFRGRGYWSMISTSRDGEYQDRIFKRFGFNTVRGSTSARGSVQATLALVKQLKAGNVLAMTPDGPRGPTRRAQPGVIYLAMKSGCPIIPVGVSASPRWLANAWDRYLIPKPFSKSVLLIGEPIYVPSDARSEEEQQVWAEKLNAEIDAIEREAERIAGADSRDEPASGGKKLWRRA